MFNPITGWWYTYPSEKYEFVSWDDEIPSIWKVIKFMFQTTKKGIKSQSHETSHSITVESPWNLQAGAPQVMFVGL